MTASFRHGFTLSLLLTLSWPGPARMPPSRSAEPSLRITVGVYNYARVSDATLSRAERKAARVFREAGIELRWVDCPVSPAEVGKHPGCEGPWGPTKTTIKILPRFMAARLPQHSGGLGLAVLGNGEQFPSEAYIFFRRVKQEARLGNSYASVVLAHVMAHEIGHLLLCAKGHSHTGIMRATWLRKDLRRAEKGLLVFTRVQADRLRAQVRARVRSWWVTQRNALLAQR
jgi:hypothetical protein